MQRTAAELREGLGAIDWFLGFLGFPIAKSEQEEYLKREAELAELLTRFWKKRLEAALIEIAEAIGQLSGPVTEAEATWALGVLQQALGPEFIGDVADEVKKLLRACYVTARRQYMGREPEWRLVDQQAQHNLTTNTLYWVGQHYDQDLGQGIADIVRKTIIESGLGRKDAAQALRSALGEEFNRSDTYWEVVASASASRSRNFGVLESFVETDVIEYEVQAMGDERMCPVCGSLDGRVFKVSDAVALRDRLLAAKTPDEWKGISPWNHGKGYAGVNTAEVPEHAKMPPFHGRCRCGMIARFDDEPGIAQQVRDAVNNYEKPPPEQLAEWVEQAKSAPWHSDFLSEHFKDHARELTRLGLEDADAYDSWARGIFTTPGVEVYAVLNKHWYPQLWFYDRAKERRAIVNVQGLQLATAHPINKSNFARSIRNGPRKVCGVQSVTFTKSVAAFRGWFAVQKTKGQIEYEAAVWAEYAAMAGKPDRYGPDGEWRMEPVIVLSMRDDLPAAAAAHPTALEADRRIFSQREALLPYFRQAYEIRAEENPPKSAWWWWLDEIVAGTYTEALPEYLSE